MRLRSVVTARRLRAWLDGRLTAASLVRVPPGARDDLLWRGRQAFEAQRYSEAERIYSLVAQLWHDHAEALLGLGACRQLQGDLAQAITLYDKALAIDPRCAHALTSRAECRFIQGDIEAGHADLESASGLCTRDPALRGRIECIRERGGLARSNATRAPGNSS